MLSRLTTLRRAHGWPGVAEAVHADLGRAEWPQTPEHVERTAAEAGVALVVVRRVKGDLLARIEERMHTVSTLDPTRPAKPFWPSPMQRYCTSDLKRGPIQKHTRTHRGVVVVSAQGMRAAESSGRAKKPVLTVDERISAKHFAGLTPAEAVALHPERGGRLVLNWLPLHDWTEADVWNELGSSLEDLDRRRAVFAAGFHAVALHGWAAHPAYILGNERLSCALCVLASRRDLVNGARHNPALLAAYIALEKRSGYTFRDGLSLSEIAAEATA